jgi:glycerophosphoryl diester phosphodiesterase
VTLVFAHRGVHQIERENTLGAFAAAVALGVHGVELDVRRTLDGTLVVHHDPAIDDFAIALTERRNLPSYVSTLREAMETLEGVRVNVEMKNSRATGETYDESGAFAREVVTMVRDMGWGDAVSISCFDLPTCAIVRSIDREITVDWLLWNVDISDAMIRAHVLGLNAINPYFTMVSDDVVTQAHELELGINVWTVNSVEDIEAMTALGVASIITDDPATALRVVGHD